RIGRTGRAGTSGTSISFAGEDDAFALPPIEALIGRKIQCEMPPDELLKPVPRRH
ncbi:MAG: ATP-dependent RNA helicase RhlB, partial [Pseudomonas sp.]|nr:ATP-dependent RNA helicase RhlB [Pseudomonas sp.]